MWFRPALLALAAAWLPSTLAFADPLACSGTCTDTHDPTLIQRDSDGTYFRFATGGGIPIYSATSLTGSWTYLGEVLPSGSSIDNSGSDDAWAPDVHYVDGTYYLYYAVSSFGTQVSAIGVASSSSMDAGSWTDHGSTGVESTTGDDYNAIDPNLIVVGSSNYLTFGSFWGDIFQTEMASDALTTAGGTPYNVEFNATSPQPSEGPYVFEYGGYYYLFFSSGTCCGYDTSRPAAGDEYKIMVCRSTSVTGAYVDATGTACTASGGTLVLGSHGTVYGPGGQSVYDDADYGPVLVYHYVDTTIGYADADKQLGINVLDFSSGWPVVNAQASEKGRIEVDALSINGGIATVELTFLYVNLCGSNFFRQTRSSQRLILQVHLPEDEHGDEDRRDGNDDADVGLAPADQSKRESKKYNGDASAPDPVHSVILLGLRQFAYCARTPPRMFPDTLPSGALAE
ncbi:Arabinan endo-1,5-alpha-L-arabinosidase A [Salinomyces thailandicus]|uniref:Endo-1,5-alpha-L-arabinanase A n=1 Tax=Salinomyces thailandicus TaxID=706561 RepID=A0A4U0U6H0_9PEZI|nr:Arabinan endo-1,5-alpha-L-arabinosidase A [Salinomyces thailandica]